MDKKKAIRTLVERYVSPQFINHPRVESEGPQPLRLLFINRRHVRRL